jgi:hypothetical protein
MVEFKIQVEEKYVQSIGYKEIEQYLQDIIQKIHLKISAREMLKDMQSLDLENDREWQTARTLAWQEQGYKYISK